MKITPEFTRLHSGESNSRILNVSIDEEHENKKVKLGFITPLGKIYITDELIFTGNTCEYSIPHMLLDGKGMLLTQLIVYENEDYIIKSPIEEYPVFSSVDDMSASSVSDESLKSLAIVFDILARKSDIGHKHDEIYYTENEINALLSLKSDTDHKHEGVYLTEEELEALLPEAEGTPFQHNHDNRYYTENEISALLSEKQDKLTIDSSPKQGSSNPVSSDGVYSQVNKLSTDYIVEQGTSGIWTYRKWASGIAECWGQKTIKTAITQEWGNLFYSGGLQESQVSFPFTFKEVPMICADIQPGDWLAIALQGSPSATNKSTGVIRLIRSNILTTEEEYTLNYTVKGRWK